MGAIASLANYRICGSDWQIWQKTEHGQLNGHKGIIDINLFRGNYDSFKKYIDQ